MTDPQIHTTASPAASIHAPRSGLLLVVAWLVVLVPALWGVSQTVTTSLKLFQSRSAPAGVPAATVPASMPPRN